MSKKAQTKREKEITRQIHRLFWRHMTRKPGKFVFAMSVRFLAFGMVHLLMPLVVANGLAAIINKQFDIVSGYVWQLLGLALVFGVLWTFSNLIIIRILTKAGLRLQQEVFQNFLNKDYDFYANSYAGALGDQATRMREAFLMYTGVFLLDIPKMLVVMIGSAVVIAFQSPLLALVTLLLMASVLSYTVFSSSLRLIWRRKLSEASSNVAAMVGDALTQAAAVKSFAAEGYEVQRISKTLKIWEKAQFGTWFTSSPADTVRYVLVAIATAVLLVMTAGMYQNGSISITIVALVQLYVIKMLSSTIEINVAIKMHEAAMGNAYEPMKTMLVQPEIKDRKNTQRLLQNEKIAELGFSEVSYGYSTAKKSSLAVQNFSLTIAPGEKVGLVGYSGSGKTTLTKLILRFMDTTSGVISISGHDIKDITQKDLRRHISYVPQEPLLFHRSIAENIGYGKPFSSKEDVDHAAKLAFVDEFAKDLPHGYDTMVGERGVKLSGGQRQRVAIARAILKNAPILILDEATSALDSRSEQLIQKALWSLMKDRTALVIAHRLSTIQKMDRIVVMDKGKIVQIGTHAALLKEKTGIYAELWAHQSGGYIGIPEEKSEE